MPALSPPAPAAGRARRRGRASTASSSGSTTTTGSWRRRGRTAWSSRPRTRSTPPRARCPAARGRHASTRSRWRPPRGLPGDGARRDKSGARLMCLPFDHTPGLPHRPGLPQRGDPRQVHGRGVGPPEYPGPPRDNWYYDRSVAHGGAMLDCLVYPAEPADFAARAGAAGHGDGEHPDPEADRRRGEAGRLRRGRQRRPARRVGGRAAGRRPHPLGNLLLAATTRRSTAAAAPSGLRRHGGRPRPARRVPSGEPVEWQGLRTAAPSSMPTCRAEHRRPLVTCIRERREPRCSATSGTARPRDPFPRLPRRPDGEDARTPTPSLPRHYVPPGFFRRRRRFLADGVFQLRGRGARAARRPPGRRAVRRRADLGGRVEAEAPEDRCRWQAPRGRRPGEADSSLAA